MGELTIPNLVGTFNTLLQERIYRRDQYAWMLGVFVQDY